MRTDKSFWKLQANIEDREIAARAVSVNASMMSSVGETFCNDRTFVEEMIRATHGSAFYHVRNIFGNDREIVELAVRERPSNFSYVGSEIAQDRSFILKLVEMCPFFVFTVFTLPLFSHDREIILKCIEKYPTAITLIPAQFRNDRKMAMECMKRASTVFSLQNFTFRNDKEMALMYLKENPQGFATICEELRSDRQVVKFVLNTRPDLALKHGLVQNRDCCASCGTGLVTVGQRSVSGSGHGVGSHETMSSIRIIGQ